MRKKEHTSNVGASVLEERKETKYKVQRVDTLNHTCTRGASEKKLNKYREGDEEMEAGCSKDIRGHPSPTTVATATEMVTDPQELNVIPSTEGSEGI